MSIKNHSGSEGEVKKMKGESHIHYLNRRVKVTRHGKFISPERFYYWGNKCYRNNLFRLAKFFKYLSRCLFACDISPSATIGDYVYFPNRVGIVIGNGVVIGKNCMIFHKVTLGWNRNCYPVIGDNVVIYPHTLIAGKVNIRSNSVIGGFSCIKK